MIGGVAILELGVPRQGSGGCGRVEDEREGGDDDDDMLVRGGHQGEYRFKVNDKSKLHKC